MKSAKSRLLPKAVRFDKDERYTRLFSVKNSDAKSLRSGCVVLKEREDIGEHNTGAYEEIIIVIEGKGELVIKGGRSLHLEKDVALYVPPETVHNVKNTDQIPLRYIFVTCPVADSEI